MRVRIESKLRLSMETFGAPLSPSLPSSNGDDAAPHADRSQKADMGGQQESMFFSEQDFSRFSHQSELFRQRWTELQAPLQAIYTAAQQEREREQRERNKAAAAAPATPSLARTVTFTTPETVALSPSPQNPAPEAKQKLQPSPVAALARSPSAVASTSPSLSVSLTAIARNDMDIAAHAAGIAVPRPSRTSSLSAEEHQAFLLYQQQVFYHPLMLNDLLVVL